MKSDINTKLNQMSAAELKEIIDNSFLYDTEIIEKAKELFTGKEKASSQVVENIPTKTPAPSITHKKGFVIVGVSVFVILVALIATVFGIRATNADKYILVEENCDGSLSTYEYEFDLLNRVTKRYTYTDGELFGTSYYNSEGKYKEVIGFEDSDCTTYTLKSQTDDVIEWSFDDGNGTGIMTEKYNSHGDVIEAIQPTTDGEIVYKYSYQYDNNGNKTKGVTEIFYNNQKVQHDLDTNYTYLTVKEYQNRTTKAIATVKGNIELRDCNGKVWLTKEDIKNAVAITENDSSYVELTFTASGKEKFASATEQISALGDGQNNIQIYLNDELISAPVVTEMLETDTVNIAPLTSEDATNIANAINDGNYTDGYISYVSNEPNTAPTKEIRVFTNATFEPFEYYSGSNMVGFDIDLINALCDKLGYEAIIEDVEFDAVMNGIAEAKADCGIAGIAVTEERNMSVDFSDIYISCYVDYGDGQGKVEQDFAIAFPKGSSLIGEFNSAIELAKTDGTIDALVEKWNVNTVD